MFPKAYWTPTLAPAGIVFYKGTSYPGWQNSLVRLRASAVSSCGALKSRRMR